MIRKKGENHLLGASGLFFFMSHQLYQICLAWCLSVVEIFHFGFCPVRSKDKRRISSGALTFLVRTEPRCQNSIILLPHSISLEYIVLEILLVSKLQQFVLRMFFGVFECKVENQKPQRYGRADLGNFIWKQSEVNRTEKVIISCP